MIAALLALTGVCAGFEPPATPAIDRPVVDRAEVLADADKDALATILFDHHDRTGVQLAVLTVSSTAGEAIEDYAHRVASAWGGGAAGSDRGALFVLAISDRRMRLELGYGLEPVIPDARARALIDRARPMLRQADYAGGVRVVVDGVLAATRELRPDQATPWSVRTVGLLYGIPDWYLLFYVLGVVLCASPVLLRVRHPGETLAARARRRRGEVEARAKKPDTRSWYDELPWQQRLVRNPWTPITMALVLWGATPALIALVVPGVRLWNMTVYLVGGLFGLLAAAAWLGRRRALAIFHLIVIAALGVAVFYALQLQPLPGAESGNPETFLGVTFIFVGIPVLLLTAPMLGSHPGTRGASSASSSSRPSTSSSSSSGSSSSSSSSSSGYGGGGGRFGGGGASGSW